MPSLDVGSASLYYEEKGSGRPVVFVHGIPTDYRAWAAQREPFSEGRMMISYSRRYAAPNRRSGDVSDSTVQNNSDDLKGIIENLGTGPVDLVGHSYGGFISAYFAAEHPEMVRSLVLVEPAISTFLVSDQASSAQLLGLLLRSPSVALSGRRFQKGSLAPSLKALEMGDTRSAVELNVDGVQDARGSFGHLPQEVQSMMLDNARTVAELRTVFPRFTATEAGRIRSPTLIINGEHGALFLRRIGELLSTAVPKAERATIPESRHFPHLENPSAFNEKVLGFLH